MHFAQQGLGTGLRDASAVRNRQFWGCPAGQSRVPRVEARVAWRDLGKPGLEARVAKGEHKETGLAVWQKREPCKLRLRARRSRILLQNVLSSADHWELCSDCVKKVTSALTWC